MKKILTILVSVLALSMLASCGSFKAKRVDSSEGDEKALEITDKWVFGDTERVIKDLLVQMENHKQFKNWVKKHGKNPTVFVGEVQNDTAEAYFPIDDMNDEFLNELSGSGNFVLVDAASRASILKEMTYQNDGMVSPETAKTVGKQVGADLMIFGAVRMNPKTLEGKTIKQYSVNLRMTEVEKGIEVLRVRTKIQKFSSQNGSGW